MKLFIIGALAGALAVGVVWKEWSPEAQKCHALGGDLYIEGCVKELPSQYIHLPMSSETSPIR